MKGGKEKEAKRNRDTDRWRGTEGDRGGERETQRDHLLSSWVQLSEFGDKGCCTVVTYEWRSILLRIM